MAAKDHFEREPNAQEVAFANTLFKVLDGARLYSKFKRIFLKERNRESRSVLSVAIAAGLA